MNILSIEMDWSNKVINIPKSGLKSLTTNIATREIRLLDVEILWRDLAALNANLEGIVFEIMYDNTPPYNAQGINQQYRRLKIISGYTVTFENGDYTVDIANGVSNILEIVNKNKVIVRHRTPIVELLEEGHNTEIKSYIRWDVKREKVNTDLEYPMLLRPMAAFMNSNGGDLFIGIDDDQNILGLDKDYETFHSKIDRDQYQIHILDLIEKRLSCKYIHSIHIEFHIIEDKEICLIKCPQSDKPIIVNFNDESYFCIRDGNRTLRLKDQAEIDKYIKNHWP